MKLTSEPKPVKIRIVSGGEEHSSLDSLRQNFCVSDLQKIESQLTQWLNKQGKEGEDIVQELEKIPTSLGNCNSEDYLLVYKVFFKDILPSPISSLRDVHKWFDRNAHKYRKTLKNLQQILWGVDEEYTLSVINQKENITGEMISKLRKEDSAQAHFLLGVYYAEIGNNTHLGVNLLRKAKKEGHKGAKRYLEEHNHVANPIIKWPDINISFMKDYIDDVINGKSSVFAPQHKWTTNEDTVRKFVLYCLSLRTEKHSSYEDIFMKFFRAKVDFNNDILNNEARFILFLIGLKTKKYENPSKQVLEELSNSYYPAKYILNDKEIHPILDEVKFRKQPLFKQIEILLINLFEF